jgi:hypothetical protein
MVPDVAEVRARLVKAGCKVIKDEPQYPRCYIQDMQAHLQPGKGLSGRRSGLSPNRYGMSDVFHGS